MMRILLAVGIRYPEGRGRSTEGRRQTARSGIIVWCDWLPGHPGAMAVERQAGGGRLVTT